MKKITYISDTALYSGVTTLIIPTSEIGSVQIDDTLMMVVSCHDIGLSPTTDPDWYPIMDVEGISGSTFVFLHNHITSPYVVAQETISNISSQLNCGFIMRFSGCTYVEAQLVNASVGVDNKSGITGNHGFTTSKNNTMIIQIASMFANVTTSNWSSTPALSWKEIMDNGATRLSYTIHIGAAISPFLAPKNTYTNFNYDLSASTENISIAIALTPRTIPNTVLNLLQSF